MVFIEYIEGGGKCRRVYEALYEKIVDGSYGPGEKLPGEIKLAETHDVSRPTVAKALDMLEKKGLIYRRAGSGTYVRKFSPVVNKNLGLLVPRVSLKPDRFEHFISLFSSVISQISRTAAQYEHILLLNDLPWGDELKVMDEARDLCKKLIEIEVKGVFFQPIELSEAYCDFNEEIADMLHRANIAVTLIDKDIYNKPYRSDYDLVAINHEQAGFDLTQYLLSLGCKRIDFLAGPVNCSSVTDRICGYMNSLKLNGIEPEESRVHRCQIIPLAGMDKEAEKHAVQETFKNINADAVICVNDRTAAIVIEHITAMGIRVPDDIRIVGFDDETFCGYLPVPLTTMRQPTEAIGKEAVRTMINRLEEPGMPARDVLLKAQLVVRASCGGKAKRV